MKAQIFKTPSGDEMVILPRAQYEALLERVAEAEEDAADIAAYDAAKAANGGERREMPGDEVRGYFLRARRKESGMTQAELAFATGLAQGYVSDLESGRRNPSGDALDRIGRALGLSRAEVSELRAGYGISEGR